MLWGKMNGSVMHIFPLPAFFYVTFFNYFFFEALVACFDQILFRLFPQLLFLFYPSSWFFSFQQWYLVYPQISCVVEWLMAVKFHGIRHLWFLLKSVWNLWIRIGGLPLANNDFELNHCMADLVTGQWVLLSVNIFDCTVLYCCINFSLVSVLSFGHVQMK